MRKLHHYGKKICNAAQTKICFGGKSCVYLQHSRVVQTCTFVCFRLKVKELLYAVAKKVRIEPAVIDRLDLDNVVEQAVAAKKGREVPPDESDSPVVEPTPSTEQSEPFMPTPSPSPSPQPSPPPSPPPPPPPPEAQPEPEPEPKNFIEKRHLYARDPKRLHDAYKSEWDRLGPLTSGRRAQSKERPSRPTAEGGSRRLSNYSNQSSLSASRYRQRENRLNRKTSGI